MNSIFRCESQFRQNIITITFESTKGLAIENEKKKIEEIWQTYAKKDNDREKK